MPEHMDPMEQRRHIVEQLDDGCETLGDVLLRIRELRQDAKVRYNAANSEAERKEHWRMHEVYDELVRVSTPRKINAILSTYVRN
jgi:hypothetical protein